MPFEPPGVGVRKPVYAAWSTSLAPIQIETKVGRASRARCTCVLPPRMIAVSAFDATGPGALVRGDGAGRARIETSRVGDADVVEHVRHRRCRPHEAGGAGGSRSHACLR